ncbi:MAG: multidrug MFS transporter [Rhodocyclales bacterium RIFCSPLOWO2_02_FULL_63_24]|nr:MAG: multidrug MFS transporter [Rhodocyclales bacterium RIFCSPLOWO2_02_FULL_63_24]
MRRSALIFLHDLTMVVLAWLGAYWLRFNLDIPVEFIHAMWSALVVVIPVQGIVFYAFGLYRGLWRFASVSDLKRILIACGVAALASPAALVMAQQLSMVPRSVFILDPLLLVLLMGGVRFTYRAWKDGHFFLRRTGVGTPVLIVGAGETAMGLIKELEPSRVWRVVGFVDAGSAQAGRQLGGVPILGGLESIGDHAQRSDARHAIIAMPSASVAERRRATELAAAAGLSVLTVPSLDDLLTGRVAISAIRKVELEDLLGRDRIELDEAGLQELLADKTVLVTGAGGSIGSELCRQIACFGPRKLVFLEQSEFALYSIEQEFAGRSVDCVVGDVKDAARMGTVFAEYRPDVVFHAAAYKHVPLMECANAWEAVRNNVQGTLNVARAALANGTGEFVLISTDKAVNPTNVMGASKRLAEVVCQAVQAQSSATRFVMVRFGNVLGSSGSVIPRFREQIAKGGPVTVTHPDIIRYFMLIPEAAQLVLQAGLMAVRAAEGGRVFVLDMGEPVKIIDLARDMIRLSGFSEDEIKIEFTGLRPGEKLYEELLADGEATLPTPHPKLRIARPSAVPDAAWLAELEDWLAAPWRDQAEVKEGLRRWVPEYRPATH